MGPDTHTSQWAGTVQVAPFPLVIANAVNELPNENLSFNLVHHMTGRLDFLFNIHNILRCFIGLPNGSYTIANSEGIVTLDPKLVLHNVLYVPHLMCNLISIS